MHFLDRARAQVVVDGASLVAANALSRIIIEDDHFGYVSLSNYPPIGKATCAPDGEPLPVTGINTIVGTTRQNDCLAQEIENYHIKHLVAADCRYLKETIKSLNKCLNKSLKDENTVGSDIHGSKVSPLLEVHQYLQSHLPDCLELESLSLSNGWLSEGSSTSIGIPKPRQWAQLKENQYKNDEYRAFVDIPTHENNFTFAGLGPASSLVNSSSFQRADEKHICSIIKVECHFKLKNLGPEILPQGLDSMKDLRVESCAQPYSLPDDGPRGIMTVRFTSKDRIAQLRSWRDFLYEGTFQDKKVTLYDVQGGDYPVDPDAKMTQRFTEYAPSTTQQFSENFYYWLRNGHLRPHLDAIVEMINEPFQSAANEIYAYEFTSQGKISRRIIAKDPFPIGVTAEAQLQSVADTSLSGGLNPIIIFRNDVKNLGLDESGKHCGQPLAGYPLNWCELPEYGGDEGIAGELGKGKLGTKLSLVDPEGTFSLDEAEADPEKAPFRKLNGNSLAYQPRRSFYSGGLALDIEIGGMRASTANDDISRMRAFTRGREI
jgi:hypothetical protein